MSIIGKIKKTAKDAGDSVKKTTDKAGDSLKKAGDKVVDVADDTFDNTRDTAKKAYGQMKKAAEQGLSEVQKQMLKNEAIQALFNYKEPLLALAKSSKTIVTSAAGQQMLWRLKTSAKSKKLDAPARASLSQMAASPEMIPAVQSARRKSFLSLSCMFGGDAEFGLGGEGSLGYAMGIPNPHEAKGVASLGGILGAAAGGSAGTQFGIWLAAPPNLKGGYIAVEVEAEAEVGAGLQVIFEMPAFRLVGFVISPSLGAEAKFALAGGYTWTFV